MLDPILGYFFCFSVLSGHRDPMLQKFSGYLKHGCFFYGSCGNLCLNYNYKTIPNFRNASKYVYLEATKLVFDSKDLRFFAHF